MQMLDRICKNGCSVELKQEQHSLLYLFFPSGYEQQKCVPLSANSDTLLIYF